MKENAIIFKRKFTSCACCPDSFLIALRTNAMTIPELLVEDSAKALLNRPSNFKIDNSYNAPIKVVLSRKIEYVKICQDSGVHIGTMARNFETSFASVPLLEKGSATMILDSLLHNKPKKYFFRNNPKDIVSNTFKGDRLQIGFSVTLNLISFGLSFELKKHNNFKYDMKDTLSNIFKVSQVHSANFAQSNFSSEPNGRLYITRIDSVKKVVSGKYNVDIFPPDKKRKVNVSGYFYQIPISF